jgi:hypothetical protein
MKLNRGSTISDTVAMKRRFGVLAAEALPEMPFARQARGLWTT